MKYYTMLFAFCLSCFTSFGAELPDELAELKEARKGKVKIGGVIDDTVRGDDDEKFEVLKFYTSQYEDDELVYRVRVTMEITDKDDNIYFARLAREQGPLHPDYIGEDRWAFQVPHGDLKRPKLTAYAIQYGFFKDGILVPLAEEFDDVDSVDEIMERAEAGRLDMQITLHTYQFRNEGAGEDGGDEILTTTSNHEKLK